MLEREWTLNSSDRLALEFQRSMEAVASKDQLLKEVHLHEIKRIEDYLRINRPLLSPARRKIIEEKLDLEKIAEKSAHSRTKRDDYFIRYDYNPLSEKENVEINRVHSRAKLRSNRSAINLRGQKFQEEVGLPDAVNNIRNHNFKRDNRQILKVSANSKHISSEIRYNAKNLSYKLGGDRNRSNLQDDSNKELSFEQILALPDKNYYLEHQGAINIFEVMEGNDRSILSKDILVKFHFNFTSCVDKLQKYKIYIYRELSQLSRLLVQKLNVPKNVRLDVLNSYEMSISIKDIRFADLISVCSGRFDPPLVYSILFEGNAQKDASPSHSFVDDDEDPINYQPNHHQKQTDYNYDLSSKQERDHYLMLENSPYEEKLIRRYQNIYRNVEKSVEEVRKIRKHTINDVKLHNQYRKIINKEVKVLVEMDKPKITEPEKLIRENKNGGKNRQERLKIRELLKTIQLTNHYHQKLAPIVSKSKKKL